MNLKSCKYMEGAEFKERQGSFEYFCAQAVDFLKAFRDECRAGWRIGLTGHLKRIWRFFN